MKISVFVLTLLSVMILPVQAQKFQLGVKVGYNSTSFNTSNYKDFEFSGASDDFKNGYLFGAYSRIGLLGNLSLQPEIYYSKKTGSTNFSNITGDLTKEKVTYYSWDVPILAHLEIIDLKILKIYGIGGPVASFKTDDKSSFPITNTNNYTGEDLKKMNWNMQLGGGLQISKLTFDIRYEWGLNDVSDAGMDRKSKALLLSLGYRLF
ncbi:porin family protein [Geofilum sp. OHC36d9]|uniref:porin family protein n=1 Tax=Geofilum sp. OHC36d9 TaxID=3458413 RepID=UPI0040348F65